MTPRPDALSAASGPPVAIFATFVPKPGCEREVPLLQTPPAVVRMTPIDAAGILSS